MYLKNGLTLNHQIYRNLHNNTRRAYNRTGHEITMYFRPEVIDVRKEPKITPQTALGRIVVARRFASPPIGGFLVLVADFLAKTTVPVESNDFIDSDEEPNTNEREREQFCSAFLSEISRSTILVCQLFLAGPLGNLLACSRASRLTGY